MIEIQCRLFDLGAAVATPVQTSSTSKLTRTKFDAAYTKKLEEWIDSIDSQLPPLKNFVIPVGKETIFNVILSVSYIILHSCSREDFVVYIFNWQGLCVDEVLMASLLCVSPLNYLFLFLM